jgi:hypothetical protein
MRKGLDINEVLSFSKTMEVKFTVSGPAMAVQNPELILIPMILEKGVLQRWYKAVSPLLKVIMERVAI